MFESFSTISGTFRNWFSGGYAQITQFAFSFAIVSGYRKSILTEMIIASLNTLRETSISTKKVFIRGSTISKREKN